MYNNGSTSAAGADQNLQAFAAFWYSVWMTGNVIAESVGIPTTFVSSIMTISVLCFVKQGIAVSAKIYYFTLAVMDFFAVFGYHFLLSYIDEDFRYLSGNTVFVSIEIHNVLCQFIYITLRQSEHTANWLYMMLCIEKLIAVEKPLVARNKFTKKWSLNVIIVCIVTGFPIDIFVAIAYGPFYYPAYGVTYCIILNSIPTAFGLFVRLYISFTIYFLPSCATVLVGLLLLKSIISHSRSRKHLTADSSNSVSKAGINGAVTVLIMASIHCLIFLPLGTLSVWAFVLEFDNQADPYMTYLITYLFWLVWNISSVAHCPNLFIYIARIPQFRNTLFCKADK